MSLRISMQAVVPAQCTARRLDLMAAQLFPAYSRARLQAWIRDGSLTVNARSLRPRDPVRPGDRLQIEAELAEAESWAPEAMSLNVRFEDRHLLVIDKPAGLVVHPAAGNRDGTLLNGLLHYHPPLAQLPRAGIVHRLDKDTSGLMVVARSLVSHASLVRQLQARSLGRTYEAVVRGVLTGGGIIDAALGRHPIQRRKRAVVADGQAALTRYRVLRRFRAHTHVEVHLETGRTHQIRVHMAHDQHPLVGDALYGGRLYLPGACSERLRDCLRNFKRQALHACRLRLDHPVTGADMSWEAPRPPDLVELLDALAEDSAAHGLTPP